jgi:hypothetical protein
MVRISINISFSIAWCAHTQAVREAAEEHSIRASKMSQGTHFTLHVYVATHFTCFPGTKVQRLTQRALLDSVRRNEQVREIAEQVLFHLLLSII